MAVVAVQRGLANGRGHPMDGRYLAGFDFEAHGGNGEASFTRDLDKAMKFADLVEFHQFYRRSPRCKPLRGDGQPNRPMTAATWELIDSALLERRKF